MPVPTYDQFIEPVLRYLAKHPGGARARDVYEGAADTLMLSAEDRQELLPSGAQATYKNRVGWAHDRLKRAGYSSCPRRGYWQLTKQGLDFAKSLNGPIPSGIIGNLASVDKNSRLRPLSDRVSIENNDNTTTSHELITSSPDDRLESALEEIRSSAR